MSDATPHSTLTTIGDVEAMADQLSASADALHARLKADIQAHQGDFSAAEQAVFRRLNDAEQLLRQRANRLYADAAAALSPLLGAPRQRITALTADATEKIRKVGKLGEVIGLVGGLLALAGSAMSGNLSGVIDALDQVQIHTAGVAAHQKKPPG